MLAALVVATLLSGAPARASTGALHILHTTPGAGATDVPANGFISITFDRPVVTLNTVGVAGADSAATISPAVPGKGRWINTSTWTYQASKGLALGTRYVITPRAGLTAQDGAILAGAAPFSFATLRPNVLSVTPANGTPYVLPKDAVQVLFNQPMQHASAQAAFHVTVDGHAVSGRFTWNETQLATQPNGANAPVPPQYTDNGQIAPGPAADTLLTFHPAAPLPLGAQVQVTIAAGVLGTGGPLGMAAPYSWSYSITGPLAVTGSTPNRGATSADLSQGAQITFSAPVSQTLAQRAIGVQPKLNFQYVSVDDAGTTLTVSGDFQPATSYTISLDTRAIGTAGQRLARPYRLTFVTQHATPSIQLVSQGQAAVYDAYLGANIYARVTNVPSVALSLYRLTPAQFMRLLYNAPNNWQGAPPSGAPLVASYAVAAKAPEDKTILVKQPLQVKGSPAAPGYYLVDAGSSSGGGAGDHLLVLITRTDVTLKIGQRQVFVWTTDLRSGKPAGGEAVRIVDGNGRVWASGTTNAEGIFQAEVHGLKSDDSLLQHTLQAQLTHGSDVAACGLDWNNGVGPWDYNLPFSTYQQPVRIYLTTERPIYRPGQPVYFKGIARRDNDGRYVMLPTGTPVQVQIQDARQNTVFNRRLTVDAYGGFHGKMLLSAGAAIGSYTVNAGIGVSTANTSFQVAEYQKPTYNVMVISDRGANANYVQGQTVGVQVHAHYYFGAPLAHAPVQWDMTQDDYFFSTPLFPDYDFVDPDYAATEQQTYFGQQVTQGSGKTDAQGDFHFAVPVRIGKNQPSQQLTLEAIVTGPDNTQVSERTQVVAHKAALYVGLRPADYLATAGKRTAIDVVTVSDDGTHTIGGVPVTARIYKRQWFSSYVRDANGLYYFQSTHKDTLLATMPVRTNAQGRAMVHFTPKSGGEYRVVASANDAAGHTATTATDLWVASAQEQYVPWQAQNNDRIQLVADKKSYAPGDTAHILVTAPLAGMTALVTVERGGVLKHWVTTLKTNSSQIAVPILGYYTPDVYVSVTLVKGPGADTNIPVWKMGYVALPVDTAARSLHVAISASVPRAAPGQKVTFTIRTTNARGQGVQAQLAVSLVDKAVLALADNATSGLMDTFYSQRELGVESAATLNLYIDRLNLNQQVGAKGGSGGGGGGQGPTRQQFPDTAYWNPSVTTDANGYARVTITLPDNLTTWTFSALGGTAGTLVGQQTLDLISTKSLLLEPALPRFLTLGDVTRSGAVVTNLTAATQRVRVTLHVSGAGPAADYGDTVSVPANGSQLVTWPIHADAIGTQTYLFSAQSLRNAALGDRLQVSLPVQPNSIAQVDATSGLFGSSTTQTVQVPAGAVPNEGSLTIDLAPSLVSGLGPAADFLINYPYNCAEQLTSRAYGVAEALRVPAQVSGVGAATAAQAPSVIQTALQQLYSAQNQDGGWGWWSEDSSSPYMSAYVLEGLIALRGRGYTVDPGVLTKAIGYVRGWALNPPAATYLPNATSTLDLQAYSAYVLGEAGNPDNGLVGTLYPHRQNMLPFARAYLALAIGRAAGAHDPRVTNLLAAVEGAAQQFDAQAHWSDKAPDWLMMDNDVSATAIALDALVRLDPKNPLVPSAVRWLMTQRVDGAWNSTQSTALALRALADYVARAHPATGASRYSVRVNGKTVGSGTIGGTGGGAMKSISVPLAALGHAARVTITRQGGSGQMAYTLTLRTYVPVTTLPAAEHGVMVTRRYQPIGGSHNQAGSDVRVVLTVTAPEDLYYLVIEDPLPAGAEPVDPSLRTTSILSGITSQTSIPRGTSDLGWYVSHVEFRDDRTALFADYLPAGMYQYSYQLHLTSAGTYHALPTQAHLLYFPDVRGHGAGRLYTISPQ